MDSNFSDFKRVKAGRVSDEIAMQIRALIAAGKLHVDSKLPSERVLAEQFGCSRNTLREALRSLEHAGLIKLHIGVGGGAVVQNGSPGAIGSSLLDMYHLGVIDPEHLTQARIMYETPIIRLAIDNATPDDIEALRENIAAAEAARESGDFDRRIELHLDFHRELARISGNPIMIAVMNGVLTIMHQFIRGLDPYDNSYVTPSRKRFLRHFIKRDAEAAVAEMETLLKRLEKKYLSKAKVPGKTAVALRQQPPER